METEYYGVNGGEIINPAFAVSRHSHLCPGSDNAISVSSVSIRFHIGFRRVARVRVSASPRPQ